MATSLSPLRIEQGFAKGSRQDRVSQSIKRPSRSPDWASCKGEANANMRVFSGADMKLRLRSNYRGFLFVLRAAAVTSMSFAASFGFLAAATNSGAYDPHSFALGAAALFGAACGAVGLLVSRIRALHAERRVLQRCIEDLADGNWELKEAEERAKSLIEAQGDLIIRRECGPGGEQRITYVNDAFCALAGRARHDVVGTAFELPVSSRVPPPC